MINFKALSQWQAFLLLLLSWLLHMISFADHNFQSRRWLDNWICSNCRFNYPLRSDYIRTGRDFKTISFPFPVSYWIWGSVECESSESVLRGLLFNSVISIHGFWSQSLKLSFSAGHTISKARVWIPSSSSRWLFHTQPAPLKNS